VEGLTFVEKNNMMKNNNFYFTFIASLCMLTACNPKTNTTPMESSPEIKPKSLEIKPSATSSKDDFDFLVGKWKVKNQRLTSAENEPETWVEFDAELHMKKTIGGLGNVENLFMEINGAPFEGMAVRLFNPKTKLWKVYWMDSNNGTMDENPVTGSFENGVGKLYSSEIWDEQAVTVLYQWDATDKTHPKWSQATSKDDGKTWVWNWKMVLTRIEG
jgi:hypothetical protein